MSGRKLIFILIAVAALGAGVFVIRSQFSERIANVSAVKQRSQPTVQKRAEQESEQQAIDAACAALQKIGKTNKNCPPQ
jgi:uncharacterized protein HemX